MTNLQYDPITNNMPFRQGHFFPFLTVKNCGLFMYSHCDRLRWLIPSSGYLTWIVMNNGKVNRIWSCMIPINKLFWIYTSKGTKGGLVFNVFMLGPMNQFWYIHILLPNYSVTRCSSGSVFDLIDTTVFLHGYTHPTTITIFFTDAVANEPKMIYPVHGIFRQAPPHPFPLCF